MLGVWIGIVMMKAKILGGRIVACIGPYLLPISLRIVTLIFVAKFDISIVMKQRKKRTFVLVVITLLILFALLTFISGDAGRWLFPFI